MNTENTANVMPTSIALDNAMETTFERWTSSILPELMIVAATKAIIIRIIIYAFNNIVFSFCK